MEVAKAIKKKSSSLTKHSNSKFYNLNTKVHYIRLQSFEGSSFRVTSLLFFSNSSMTPIWKGSSIFHPVFDDVSVYKTSNLLQQISNFSNPKSITNASALDTTLLAALSLLHPKTHLG